MAELIAGMFNSSQYKRSQGKVARQLTLAAIAITFAVGAWKLSDAWAGEGPGMQYGVPLAVLAAGVWAGFRIVNIPRFADFLISVEAEMNKVQWPGRSELWRASLVVIVVIFFLAGSLFVFDIILDSIFSNLIGI